MRFARLLLLLLPAVYAGAHPLIQDILWVSVGPATMRVAADVSAREILVAQDIPDGRVTPAVAARHADYVMRHLAFSSSGVAMTGRLIAMTAPAGNAAPESAIYRYEFKYGKVAAGNPEIVVTNTMLTDRSYAPGVPWDVSYVLRVKREGDVAATSLLLARGATVAIPGSAESPAKAREGFPWTAAYDYFCHGIRHILTGYDHLLFVSALAIGAKGVRDLVGLVAAFTLAHTMTLTLSVLGIFRLSPAVVEPLIALSIVVVALENLSGAGRGISRVRLASAFGFGLVHGLGFAGGLIDAMAGLPAAGVWVTIAAFSLGVEAGHQLVVLPLFGLMRFLRRRPGRFSVGRITTYVSLAIAVAGACYFSIAVREQWFSRPSGTSNGLTAGAFDAASPGTP